MSDYMTFEQAAAFLNTPRSTLYRWLREGKVPGHKLGRQWRFLKPELEAFRSGGATLDAEWASLARLRSVLSARSENGSTTTENEMQSDWTSPAQVAEQLIWDAVDHGAHVIHFEPSADRLEVRYRTSEGLERLLELPESAFAALDREWTSASKPVRSEAKRRLFLERESEGAPDRLRVRYQKLETAAGERLTLRILRERRFPATIDIIAPEGDDAASLRRMTHKPYGLVLICGRSGSGKTTTAYCCLSELAAKESNVIFTIEDPIGMSIPGVNQVEVDLDDERAYREAFSAIFDSDLDVLFVSSTFAQRHRSTLWGTALSAAETGHLVFVQVEAESAEDALEKFGASTDRPFDDHLVGVVWQELVEREGGGRKARYEFLRGPLDD